MKFKMNNHNWEIEEIPYYKMKELANDEENNFTQGLTLYSENKILINKKAPNKKVVLYHELMHCFMYEYGHNQWQKEFNHEDVCEISATAHDIIHEIAEKYFKDK